VPVVSGGRLVDHRVGLQAFDRVQQCHLVHHVGDQGLRAERAKLVAFTRSAADGILFEVRDDGKGFDPAGSFPGHLGLKSMGERVARLGATLRIESAPGEGTRVRAQIPPGT
jgi:nitrate/nitrite-specific signal transduction histidine kinase